MKSRDNLHDSMVKKLNFSVCLNNSEIEPKINSLHNFTTPCSPIKLDLAHEENKGVAYNEQTPYGSQFKSNIKIRSRNPSSSGLLL